MYVVWYWQRERSARRIMVKPKNIPQHHIRKYWNEIPNPIKENTQEVVTNCFWKENVLERKEGKKRKRKVVRECAKEFEDRKLQRGKKK